MLFRKLAKYLQKLEGTSSRNEMTKILAELFAQASSEDARLIAYLSAGKLGPAYNSPDMGIADKMMLKTLGEKAEKLFKQKGDLGLVAQELGVGSGNLSIKEVHELLMEVAKASGTGSQEKKQNLIRNLLESLDPVGAKYSVKIILGKLRTGFSDMTVLDSLSWMVTGDKKIRPDIERMYNVRADLGEIAAEIVKYRKPREIEPEVGTPILMARAERAKNPGEIWTRNGPCALEYKLDGLRIQAHITKSQIPNPKSQINSNNQNPNIKLFSRGLEDVTAMYPDVAAGLQKQIKKDCIVEGEMIAVGETGKFLPFQETVQRKRKYDIAEMAKKVPLKIYLFDLLMTNKTDMTHRTNIERREELERLVGPGETVKLMPRIQIEKETEIQKYFQKALAAGTEGIIAKKLDGPYQAGARDFNWIKYKKSYDQSVMADTLDVVVMGYDEGQGKRSKFGIGDFLAGVYDSASEKYFTVAKIGTGLTDEEWQRMKKVLNAQCSMLNKKPESYEVSKVMNCDYWVEPKIVVEVLADEITKSPMHTSKFALRFPRLVSWREKKPTDATSMKELEKMFKLQQTGGDY